MFFCIWEYLFIVEFEIRRFQGPLLRDTKNFYGQMTCKICIQQVEKDEIADVQMCLWKILSGLELA